MASRLQVAQELAGRLGSGRQTAVRQAAAWLVATGRARQAKYLAKDVAVALAAKGHVLVDVTTARPLSAAAKTNVEKFVRQATGAKHLELNMHQDPSLVGGVLVETPDAVLDATVKTKLSKYVEGVIS